MPSTDSSRPTRPRCRDDHDRPWPRRPCGPAGRARQLPPPAAVAGGAGPIRPDRTGSGAGGVLLRAVPVDADRVGADPARREYAAATDRPGPLPDAQDAGPVRLLFDAATEQTAGAGVGPRPLPRRPGER